VGTEACSIRDGGEHELSIKLHFETECIQVRSTKLLAENRAVVEQKRQGGLHILTGGGPDGHQDSNTKYKPSYSRE